MHDAGVQSESLKCVDLITGNDDVEVAMSLIPRVDAIPASLF